MHLPTEHFKTTAAHKIKLCFHTAPHQLKLSLSAQLSTCNTGNVQNHSLTGFPPPTEENKSSLWKPVTQRWGRFPTPRAATLFHFRWKGCSKPAQSWTSFPGTSKPVTLLSHFWISAPRSDIMHSVWFGNSSENLGHSSTLSKPRTFCGIHHYHHLSDLGEIAWFYGINKTVLLSVEMLLWMKSG